MGVLLSKLGLYETKEQKIKKITLSAKKKKITKLFNLLVRMLMLVIKM